MTPSRRSRCRSHRKTLDAVLDGRAAQDARQALELHAADCEECSRALDESLAMRAALDALPAPEPDRAAEDAFVDAVMKRIDRDGTASWGAPPVMRRRRAASIATWSAAAALAAAAVLATVFLREPDADPEPDVAPRIAALPPGSGTDGSVDEALVEGDVAATSTLPPVVLETGQVAARDELDALLAEITAAAAFDPSSPGDAGALLSAVRSSLSGEVAPAARAILAEDPPSPRAALAARLLGPAADHRDRDLLVAAVETLGAPAALALADRGAPGIGRLWSLAAEDAGDSASVARTTLRALVAAESAVGRAPQNVPIEVVAPILASHPVEGASVAVEGFVASGERAWLAALVAHPAASDAVAALARVSSARERGRGRLLQAIRATGAAGAAVYVVEALARGDERAVDALVALPVEVALEHLVEATVERRLRAELEERAWCALARREGNAIAGVASSWAPTRPEDVERLVDAIVRSNATDGDEGVEVVRLLVRLAALDAVDPRVRSAGLLHASVRGGESGTRTSADAKLLAALRSSSDVEVAAAAWLFESDPAEPPPEVGRALARSGGDVTVRHLRVVRALERERSDAGRRARRTGATP